MKKILFITAFLWSSLGTVLSESLPEDSLRTDSLRTVPNESIWPENVTARLDSLMNEPLLKKTQLGLLIYDLTADSVIYKQGERQTLRPASTMKLVTAITAIDKLGGGYQFRTSLYYMGLIERNILRGNLYCVGGMDPRFNNDDMRAFVESIQKMGIDTICGRLIADTSMKDDTRLGEGWCWDDDNPSLTPLLIGKKDMFMERFRQELNDVGIAVVDNEEAIANNKNKNRPLIHLCSRFHSLDQVLMRMLKESDNLYAESVLYQIAAAGGVKNATATHARQWINKLVTRIGLTPGDYKFADGSGLSLYNYISAELLVGLLRYAYHNQNIFGQLYPALPIAGVDGTLEKRMKGAFTNGNVRAKTGTLTGISSLAGYCTAANGHKLAFAIINQGVLRNASGKAFQDKVCTALCEP
ncbi:MAG: D-alanyl-D-alanine carboxypeptidase/D-alanyl-D-alanine-endopeptidase [Prevotella sp.]|nr:D-alanyl-D-alanine carboxypeptidase/D-alanyl-D-alanine-endopeptidase [Prevotella sp.]